MPDSQPKEHVQRSNVRANSSSILTHIDVFGTSPSCREAFTAAVSSFGTLRPPPSDTDDSFSREVGATTASTQSKTAAGALHGNTHSLFSPVVSSVLSQSRSSRSQPWSEYLFRASQQELMMGRQSPGGSPMPQSTPHDDVESPGQRLFGWLGSAFASPKQQTFSTQPSVATPDDSSNKALHAAGIKAPPNTPVMGDITPTRAASPRPSVPFWIATPASSTRKRSPRKSSSLHGAAGVPRSHHAAAPDTPTTQKPTTDTTAPRSLLQPFTEASHGTEEMTDAELSQAIRDHATAAPGAAVKLPKSVHRYALCAILDVLNGRWTPKSIDETWTCAELVALSQAMGAPLKPKMAKKDMLAYLRNHIDDANSRQH